MPERHLVKGFTRGQHLKMWRVRCDYTCRMGADLIGVTESCVYRWETDQREPQPGVTRAIAEAYNVPIDTAAVVLALKPKQKY